MVKKEKSETWSFILLRKFHSECLLDEGGISRISPPFKVLVYDSTDNQGNDFKVLVYEFMANGNLEDWLHPSSAVDDNHEQLKNLSIIQRINVASAIEYLHHNCGTPLVHCDLKPSNVLLDDDMVAHVGDFGLAKLLSVASDNVNGDQTNSSTTTVKGTIGYIAPGSSSSFFFSNML